MRKKLLLCTLAVLGCVAIMAAGAFGAEEKGSAGPALSEFRAFSQFRSVKLVWQSGLPAATAKSFQITRSIYYEQGPYTPLAAVEAKEGENSYTFVDKEIKSSENYYYKITVEGTGETFGPAVAKPFLSQPAT
jgi:hypothetical protein